MITVFNLDKHTTTTTMKSFIFVTILAVAYAASSGEYEILKQASDIQPDGSYQHSFETSHGIKHEEQAVFKSLGKDEVSQEVTGHFEYTDDEGHKFTVHYVANENGFQPQGDHLPVAPEIPHYIQRALEWNAAHPQKEN